MSDNYLFLDDHHSQPYENISETATNTLNVLIENFGASFIKELFDLLTMFLFSPNDCDQYAKENLETQANFYKALDINFKKLSVRLDGFFNSKKDLKWKRI